MLARNRNGLRDRKRRSYELGIKSGLFRHNLTTHRLDVWNKASRFWVAGFWKPDSWNQAADGNELGFAAHQASDFLERRLFFFT